MHESYGGVFCWFCVGFVLFCLKPLYHCKKVPQHRHQHRWGYRLTLSPICWVWVGGDCLPLREEEWRHFSPTLNIQVCKCDTRIWVINIGTTHGEVLPSLFLSRQTIIIEAIFQWWSAFKHRNTKPTKIDQKTHANQLILGNFCSLPVAPTF